MTETRTGFDVPELRRLRYFHGRLLGARDLQREQEYFRDKLKLRMRYLLGYGVVCGLFVEPVAGSKEADASAAKTTERVAKVRITPGLGVDAYGNEIVVRDACELDLWDALAGSAHTTTTDPKTVWVGVEYEEDPVDKTRTIFTSDCGDTTDCDFGWTRETYRIRVTADRPEADRRCDTCGDLHGEGSGILWLARIDDIDWHKPLKAAQIDQSIRRPFGRRVPTVITGINWRHGHTYTVSEAKELLGTVDDKGGLVIRFSDDIRVDSLRRGVIDIQVIEGGAGKNADSWFMGGEFTGLPKTEFTREFRFRQTTRETLQDDDRVLITVRSAFLLDRCCRPVDGTHVGGKVPYLRPRSEKDADAEPDVDTATDVGCALPPSGIGPWTSGVGLGGDVFESWFFVREG
ncbi:hypothetical protein ACTMTJ_13655 [Phytohabitans sp. LJ34]|uniref:hypothetical protein n=1 Tax=Phytohabitans sp. LJ34 TaxID=3452217 RepID=UPI003F8880D6